MPGFSPAPVGARPPVAPVQFAARPGVSPVPFPVPPPQFDAVEPIVPYDLKFHYWNKMEFSFGTRRWMLIDSFTDDQDQIESGRHVNGSGDYFVNELPESGGISDFMGNLEAEGCNVDRNYNQSIS
ncbi:hypothetical protein COCNU_01G010770 [Cocos nucifera]|uniref:Uncharacterized protein n=1 Tax=Cocos nucifera TaxID=13894 RepID=A0A8K0HVH7_COCNU|nr:hypothetical protein COCNU_01G010770 [Cocos nucifera]